ncbi:hypothetical protein D9M72_329550 [compost metagenome]
MHDDDHGLDVYMECPGCDADVRYEDWESIDGLDGAAQCPECAYVARLDELFG